MAKKKKKKKRKQSPKQKKILKAFRTCYKEADICPLTEPKKMTKSNKQDVHACARKKLEKQGITIKPKKY